MCARLLPSRRHRNLYADVLLADVQFVGALRTGIDVLADAWAVLVEEGRLVLEVGVRLFHHLLAQHTVVLGSLRANDVLFLLLCSPDAAHGHLRDASAISPPVLEVGVVCMAA